MFTAEAEYNVSAIQRNEAKDVQEGVSEIVT